jgi:hypothetical protein
MSVSVFSNWFGNTILQQWFLDNDAYLSLHTYAPGVLGDAGSEVAGGGYSRQLVEFTAPGSKMIGNAAKVVFNNMPGCTVTHYGFWTAVSGGNFLLPITRDTPLVVVANQELHLPISDLVLQL